MADNSGLWLIIKLHNHYFGINTEQVSSIMILPDQITKIPDTPSSMQGIISLRGCMIPLLNLRSIFGYPTRTQEYQSFVQMIEHRKEDHLRWVHELERCIEAKEKFTLATDPHACAFGKWYDQYETNELTVRHHLKKIDEPHHKLHAAALKVDECEQRCDTCQRDTCSKKILEQVKNEYVPVIVKLLDDCHEVFKNSYREMVVILEIGDKKIGVIVDEVLSTEQLESDSMQNIESLYHLDLVRGLSSTDSQYGNVMLLDTEKLLSFF